MSRALEKQAREAGCEPLPDERVKAFGEGLLLYSHGGFEPCPWAFELAHFTPIRSGDRVLDLGSGGGVLLVALGLVYPEMGLRLGLERDARAVQQARRNARLNEGLCGQRASFVRGDVRERPLAKRTFDVVVSNPPFYAPGWGRQSPDPATHAATHGVFGDVSDFAFCAAHALSDHGRVVFVFDAGQLTRALLAFAEAGLTVRALRFLDDDRGLPARVLVLAARDGGGLRLERQAHSGP